MGDVVKFRLPVLPRLSRNRRAFFARSKTENVARLTKRELRFGKMIADAQLEELGDVQRPVTRGDCVEGERPCPFVSCQHHLALDVTDAGSVKYNFPDKAVDEMPATCALDVADAGGATLEAVAAIMNITRERVRQLEVAALASFRTGGGNPYA